MVQGGAAGLPPLFAETLLGLPLKAEFPAGASAKRAQSKRSSQNNGSK